MKIIENAHGRIAQRLKVFQPAEMICGAGTRRVHLLNVSRTGALVHADRVPAAGEPVTLLCGTLVGHGRVAWSAGSRFGVAFTEPLAQADFDTLVSGPRGRAEPRRALSAGV